jgi:hypothetical protein
MEEKENTAMISTSTGQQLVDDTDHVQLQRLAIELSWRLDNGLGWTIPELFTEDGSIATLGEPVVGHEALGAWGRMMDSDESPIPGVRHVLTNLRFTADGPDRATGTVYVTAYLAGAPEGMATLPFAMGVCTDHYLRTEDGWKVVSRVFEPSFMRGDAG